MLAIPGRLQLNTWKPVGEKNNQLGGNSGGVTPQGIIKLLNNVQPQKAFVCIQLIVGYFEFVGPECWIKTPPGKLMHPRGGYSDN